MATSSKASNASVNFLRSYSQKLEDLLVEETSVLINNQENAVDAVKLEWLLLKDEGSGSRRSGGAALTSREEQRLTNLMWERRNWL